MKQDFQTPEREDGSISHLQMGRLFLACGFAGLIGDGVLASAFTESTTELPLFRLLVAGYCLLIFALSFGLPFVKKHIYGLTCGFLYASVALLVYLNHAYNFNADYSISLLIGMIVFGAYMRETWHLISFLAFTFVVTTISLLLTPDAMLPAGQVLLRLALGMVIGTGLFAMSRNFGHRIRKSEQLFRLLAEHSADLVALHDEKGVISYISPSVLDILGYSQAEAKGKNAFDFIYPADQPQVQKAYYAQLFKAHQQVKLEYRLVRKDGNVVWVEAVGTPLNSQAGLPARVMTTSRDVSARKRAEIETQQYQENLVRINNELDQFAYVVSHDLKAPLRGISNLSTFIEEDLAEIEGFEMPDDIQDNLKLLRSRVVRLEELIHDVLTYSRAGRWPAEWEELQLLPILKNIVDSLDLPEGFSVQLPAAIPPIQGAKVHFEQLFSNLIHNAWRHHHRATGNISVTYASRDAFHLFEVSDDGPGIEEKYHQRIFQVFQQLQSRDHKGGTGVGLAVVRKIVETAGGKIDVRSTVGEGTTFHFTWPHKFLNDRPEDNH